MCHSLALPRAVGTRGALVHPKRWHFSSRAVPPGPVTLGGFIPRAGPGQPERNWAVRCKPCLEKIPAPWGLQWWKDSSLHKGSHKLQPSLRALPQPVLVPCCPRACDSSTELGSCCWGWSQLRCMSPALPHCPAKLTLTEQGFTQVSPLGILPFFMLSLQEMQNFLSVACITISPGDHSDGFPHPGCLLIPVMWWVRP